MRNLLATVALATLATTILAAGPLQEPRATERELAAVNELGHVNGTALACGRTDLVSKTKALMLARVPKTRRHGEAFEEATSAAFRERTGSSVACPEAVILDLRFEAADLRLEEVFPPPVPR